MHTYLKEWLAEAMALGHPTTLTKKRTHANVASVTEWRHNGT